MRLFRITTVGLSSRTAPTMRPFTSCGDAGSATLRPGTWASQASRLWLCCSGRQTRTAGRSEDQRDLDVPAEHVLQLRHLDVELIKTDTDEVEEHQAANRPQPTGGSP